MIPSFKDSLESLTMASLGGEWILAWAVSGTIFTAIFGVVLFVAVRCRRKRPSGESISAWRPAPTVPRFFAAVQCLPVGVICFDVSGKCIYVNDRLPTIVGRPRSELIGQDWPDFVYPDDRARVPCPWRQTHAGPKAWEGRLLGAEGNPVSVIGDAMVERSADGTVAMYVVVVTDTSPLKQAKAAEYAEGIFRAGDANRAKARFLAVVSHDLRQPIQAINLFKDTLVRSGLTAEQESVARFLSLSIGALSDLVDSLLDFSRLEAGTVQPQKKIVELEQIFKSIDAMFSPLAQQRNLRFKFFYPIQRVFIYTDPGLLLSILRNLIDNAFKYTASGGVLVGVRKRKGRLVLEVWDTGIGVPSWAGDRIFEECFQIHNPMGDRAKGLGIGLSIARRTARLLGGDVSYLSREGMGSMFQISLPTEKPSGIDTTPPGASDESQRRGRGATDCANFSGWRVVVVEDDPVVAKSLELSLQALNMEVNVFHSAEEALVSPRLLGGDFYISDYVLPGMDGVGLLNAIEERLGTPIRAILMTGESLPDRMSAIQPKGWHILLKPTNLSCILSIMGNVIEVDAFEQKAGAH